MDRVAIVVVNWNRTSDTIECIESIQTQTHKNIEIVVIDNGSEKPSQQQLEKYVKKYPSCHLIKNTKNLGFSGGVNTGIRYAMENDFNYVCLLNNDAVVDKHWVSELLAAFDGDDRIGIATGLFLARDGRTIDSTGEIYTAWGLPYPRDRNKPATDAQKSGYVFGATGGASMYSIAMLRKIGMFDELFFAYYEDVDISFRAQLTDYKVWYTNKAIAYHERGSTSNKIAGFTTYQAFKNLPLLFWKNLPLRLLFPVGFRFYFLYTLMLGNAIKNGNGAPALKGVGRSWMLFFSAIRKRYSIQKQRAVSSQYIRSIVSWELPPSSKLRRILGSAK